MIRILNFLGNGDFDCTTFGCNHKPLQIEFGKMNTLRITIFTLLTLLALASCSRQVKTNLPNDSVSQDKASTENHPMIIRTQGATSGNITCELQDRDGNLWFSTSGEGVYRYDGESFTNFTTKDGLCDNDAGDIIQRKSGDILIGTNAGICKYDGKTFSNYFESDSLTELRITSLLEDREGNIWFGAMAKGLYRHDGTKVSNFLYRYEHPLFPDMREKMISDIIQDKNGHIWFSSFNRGGVWRYDGKILSHFLPSSDYYSYREDERSNANSSSYTQYVHSPDYITDDMIHCMIEDRSGNILFATRRHGICRFDGNMFTNFGESEAFSSKGVISILEDKKGVFWLGTDGGGVFSYDGKITKNYTTTDGLINNSVWSIFEDKAGNLWFGTRSFGLSRFDGNSFATFSEYKEG